MIDAIALASKYLTLLYWNAVYYIHKQYHRRYMSSIDIH